MREKLETELQAAVSRLLAAAGDGDSPPEFTVEVPRQEDHGDFACNAAMLLAKRLRKSPRDIATQLIQELGDAGGLVDRAEVAGPGFVNLWLAGERWQDVLLEILRAGSAYGHSDMGAKERVQVEFVSANPTGPLSTGHGRQAVLGDCIARLLRATGHDVTREYYFNNGGRQMRVLGESVKARYLELLGKAAAPPADALADAELPWPESIDGLPVCFPRDGYQGDYIVEIARSLVDEHGEGWVDEPGDGRFREEAEQRIFAEIRQTLDAIGVVFDVYSNEKTLYDEGRIEAALEDLRATGNVENAEGAVWLRSEAMGLPRDRVLVKSSGEPTYILPDIAYHREKFKRGFETIIDVMGADHIEQVPYVKAAMDLLGYEGDRVEFVMHQFVTLSSGGSTVKQSTRRATFITIDELVEQVGADVFRFFMIQRRPEGHLDFDLDLAKEEDWTKNPAFALQYAHARTHGIERKAAELGIRMPGAGELDPSCLDSSGEIALIRKLGEFPEVVQRAAESREPHHVAYYLRDVAGLWNPWVQDRSNRILSDDVALTAARLGLTLGVRIVLAQGLELLGMSAPERM